MTGPHQGDIDAADVRATRRTLLGIAALLLISCGMVFFLRDRRKTKTVTIPMVATGAGAPDIAGEAVFDLDTGEVKIKLYNVRPPADKDYELWMLRGEQAPRSLGIVSGLGMVKGNAPGATGFAISLEPRGGAKPKGGPPTGPVVCAGTLP